MPEEPNPKLYAGALDRPTRVEPCEFRYAELDVTTNCSFLRGASHPDELVYTAALLGYHALAITDINSLAGVVRAYAAAKSVAGFKLIVGARLVFADGSPDLLAWCPDRRAYGNLCRLLTIGKRRAPKGECHLALNDFLDHQDGLLAAVVPPTAPVVSDDDDNDREGCGRINGRPRARGSARGRLESALRDLRGAMGDRLSLAAATFLHGGGDDGTALAALADVGRRCRVPLVATNHVHYHDAGRRRLQDVLTCIRHGCVIEDAGYRLFPNGERYPKPPAEMHELFRDHRRAIDRGLAIADRCDFGMNTLKYEYPEELVPPGKTGAQHLADLTWAGAARRYPDGVPGKVRALLKKELALIAKLAYEPYFLTIHDVVRHAKQLGILCQGRGSAANSAVCYCLEITAVDPNVHDLLFARFLSEARNEPPDIDVDFEHERREEVIQYIYQKYGRDRAGMTATTITYRGRSAVRDVGKALGLPLDRVDSMAKRLDWWDRGTLNHGQLRECGIDPSDPTVRHLVGITSQLLGFPRHLSQHTGGMVMTRGPLCELVPIENAAMEGRTVIEWDKEGIEALGILKVDVLALGMLTALSKALALLNARNREPCDSVAGSSPRAIGARVEEPAAEPLGSLSPCANLRPLELHTIPHEDPETYEMMCDADTVGVFQIESRAQMSMLPRLQPRTFYDIVIEVAIVRPGPIQGNMVHPYLRRRSGLERVTYPSKELEDVLHTTLGVPLFQEQAMKVVMVAASFTDVEADRLRKAMAAWRRSTELNTFQHDIVTRMERNGYSRAFAEQVFEQISGFGEYGFPESHAASFAKLVYASAWIKRHHPAVFLCAMLNSQPMGFYQPAQLVRDAKEHGVEVRAVDVNFSDWDCTCEAPLLAAEYWGEPAEYLKDDAENPPRHSWGRNGPAVRIGFRQVKGMREDHGRRAAAAARESGGFFRSVAQFHHRTRLPVSAVRRLAEADAFGSLGLTRRRTVWEVLKLKDDDAPLFEQGEDGGSTIEDGGRTDAPAPHPSSIFDPPSSLCDHVPLPAMPIGQEVMTDYATAGLSLKRHPVALVRPALDGRKILTARQVLEAAHGRWVRVAGLVLIRQRPGTASGVVFETLEDETGVINLILWPTTYDQFRPAARYASLLQADGYVQKQGKVIHVLAKRLFDLSGLLAGLDQRSRDFH